MVWGEGPTADGAGAAAAAAAGQPGLGGVPRHRIVGTNTVGGEGGE